MQFVLVGIATNVTPGQKGFLLLLLLCRTSLKISLLCSLKLFFVMKSSLSASALPTPLHSLPQSAKQTEPSELAMTVLFIALYSFLAQELHQIFFKDNLLP